MSKKSFVAALAASAATVGILSAGTAHADAPVFNTPFIDPGCLCAGLLPGPVVTHQDHDGTVIVGNPQGLNGAAVEYITLSSNRVPITAIAESLQDQLGSIDYTTYRGRPAFNSAPHLHDENGQYTAETVFLDGNHLIVLFGGGTTPDDAVAALANLSATLQII